MKKSFSSLLFILYSLLLFLTPLLVTPFTDELFEFPKMTFLYFMSNIIFFVYILKIVQKKKITIKKTPLNTALILILISSIVSTIFSTHFITSLFGYYTRFNGNLISIFYYIILTFILVNEFDSNQIKQFLYTLITSSTLVSIYAILQKFGIDKDYWVEHSWERVFSTLGQPNWLASFLVMIIPVSIVSFVSETKNLKLYALDKMKNYESAEKVDSSRFACTEHNRSIRTVKMILYLIIPLLLIFALVFTRSASGYLAIIISLIILLFYYLSTLSAKIKKRWTLGFIILIVLTTFLMIPLYSKIDTSSFVKETNQIRLITWRGTFNLIKDKPIIGYGLETFAYSFLPFRPSELNYTSEWNFLVNKPHNEYLEILSESGLLGLGAYLFLITTLIFWVKKNWQKLKNKNLIVGLLSGYIGLLVTLFFGFQVVVTNMLFFLFPAFICALSEIQLDNRTVKLKKVHANYILAPLSLFFILYSSFLLSRFFVANIYFNHGVLTSLEKAVKLAPYENTYRRHLAFRYAKKTIENPDYEEKATTEIQNAYRNNPNNYISLQTLTKSYLELSSINIKYLDEALNLAKKQTEIVPTDPEAWYTYGLILIAKERDTEARQSFEKALTLKSDYNDAKEMITYLSQ